MDTEILVKAKVELIETALHQDNKQIQLVIAPLDEDWGDMYVIYAKPLAGYESKIDVIEDVTSKLYTLADNSIRKYISHVQVLGMQEQSLGEGKAVEKLFHNRIAA